MYRSWFACAVFSALVSCGTAAAQEVALEPTQEQAQPAGAAAESDAAAELVGREGTPQRAEAIAALKPLADAILAAEQTRATIELTSRSMIHGRVVASEEAIYQIASKRPNRYNVQLKGGDQMLQVISNGTVTSVVLGGAGYFEVPAPATLQEVVPALPLPLGPYPEPLMALSLAGANLPASFITEMDSLVVADREPRGEVAAAHIRGVQPDGVTWSLWVATEAGKPRPLRLKVDLTKVVVGDDGEGLPDGFAYELDAQFTQWRIVSDLDDRVFQYVAPADIQKFESLDALVASLQIPAGEEHPLVGQQAPEIESTLVSGETFRLSDLQGKVVMLDFWATWCGPCIQAMPVIAEVGKSLADKGVVTYAMNIGETKEEIEPFLAKLKIDLPVVLDAEGEIADHFHTEAIPQTVLIGKDGRVAAVHVGFGDLDEFKQQLTEQLQALIDAPASDQP